MSEGDRMADVDDDEVRACRIRAELVPQRLTGLFDKIVDTLTPVLRPPVTTKA